MSESGLTRSADRYNHMSDPQMEPAPGFAGFKLDPKVRRGIAAAGFRAHVVGYDPNKSSKEMQALGIEAYENLHAMLAQTLCTETTTEG